MVVELLALEVGFANKFWRSVGTLATSVGGTEGQLYTGIDIYLDAGSIKSFRFIIVFHVTCISLPA